MPEKPDLGKINLPSRKIEKGDNLYNILTKAYEDATKPHDPRVKILVFASLAVLHGKGQPVGILKEGMTIEIANGHLLVKKENGDPWIEGDLLGKGSISKAPPPLAKTSAVPAELPKKEEGKEQVAEQKKVLSLIEALAQIIHLNKDRSNKFDITVDLPSGEKANIVKNGPAEYAVKMDDSDRPHIFFTWTGFSNFLYSLYPKEQQEELQAKTMEAMKRDLDSIRSKRERA